MSEHREHCPLLPDTLSDDDQFLPREYRRRSINRKNRIKASLKGATSIIKHWPDHWTAFVTYWWIGFGMISLTTFIIYNSFVSLTLMPKAYLKPVPKENFNSLYKFDERDARKSVFLHVFSNSDKDIDLQELTPHINFLAEKHPSYIFRIIIVLNDTNLSDYHERSDEENNEIAMNALWSRKVFSKERIFENTNIRLEYISLTRYLDNSAISKCWRELSDGYIKFMVRAISVWDKGGIAFNPIILTSQSHSEIYLYKVQNILSNYENDIFKIQHKTLKSVKVNNNILTHRNEKPKFNNIQDIINALENNEQKNSFSDEQLAGMENKKDFITERETHKNFAVTEIILPQGKTLTVVPLENNVLDTSTNTASNSIFKSKLSYKNKLQSKQSEEDIAATTVSLLPKFLNFLFHRNSDIHGENIKKEGEVSSSLGYIQSQEVITSCEPNTKANLENKDAVNRKTPSDDNESYSLSIDLKGNIIATNTICHAFIGNLFNDAIHYKGIQNLTEFIVAEISTFCPGTCKDIDVIQV